MAELCRKSQHKLANSMADSSQHHVCFPFMDTKTCSSANNPNLAMVKLLFPQPAVSSGVVVSLMKN